MAVKLIGIEQLQRIDALRKDAEIGVPLSFVQEFNADECPVVPVWKSAYSYYILGNVWVWVAAQQHGVRENNNRLALLKFTACFKHDY